MILNFDVQEVANMKLDRVKVMVHHEHKKRVCRMLLMVQEQIAKMDKENEQ